MRTILGLLTMLLAGCPEDSKVVHCCAPADAGLCEWRPLQATVHGYGNSLDSDAKICARNGLEVFTEELPPGVE